MTYNPPKANGTRAIDAPVKRTSKGLRDMLFDELDLLRSGQTDIERARAVGMIVRGIVDTVKLEIDVARLADGKQVNGGKKALEPLRLGHEKDEAE